MTCAVIAIPVAIFIDCSLQNANTAEAMNVTASTTPQVVQMEVVIDWTPERVAEEVRAVFPEQPELAVKVFKCESGLVPTAKGPTSDYGIAQIHSPSWDREAKRLGYEEYKTDVKDNLAVARHIYDNAGGKFTDWVCYTKKMY